MLTNRAQNARSLFEKHTNQARVDVPFLFWHTLVGWMKMVARYNSCGRLGESGPLPRITVRTNDEQVSRAHRSRFTEILAGQVLR